MLVQTDSPILATGGRALAGRALRARRLSTTQEEARIRRARLLQEVTQHPGQCLGELEQRLCLGWGTLYHHLSILAKERKVVIEGHGRRQLVFPLAAKASHREVAARALLRGRTTAQVARAIVERPGSDIAEIARCAAVTERVAYHHVQRLRREDLVQSSSKTRIVGLTPSPLLAFFVSAIGPLPAPAEPLPPASPR